MRPAIEGSNAIDLLCLSFVKENEKGLTVVPGGAASKESNILENIEIKVENSELRSNNTLQTENGKIIKFDDKAFEKVKENKENRKTQRQEEIEK